MNVIPNILLITQLIINIYWVNGEEFQDRKDLSILSVFYNNSLEFRKAFVKSIDISLELPARMKNSAVKTIKSYTLVEPTPKETADADQALSDFFGLFSSFLPDTEETMSTFCDESEQFERRQLIRVYIIRKYTGNFICRLAFHLISTRVEKQNDFYCSSDYEKALFIQHANGIKNYFGELDEARKKFKSRLISIQHTNLGYTNARALCCSFWQFKNDTLIAITNQETKQFIEDMFEKYFHLMTQYFCFYNTVLGCKSFEYPMKVSDIQAEKYSLAMNLIRATAKVTSLLL